MPPPAPEKREIPRDENMLAFSIVPKLLLPTNMVDRIDLLFKKLLKAKVPFQSVSMAISRTVERYPPVLQCCSAMLDRCIVRPFPLVARIREIVQWFAPNLFDA
jgi:hypothetical protein